MQAVDQSRVCMISMLLASDGFEDFRCDRPLMLGMHVKNLSKVLKCAGGRQGRRLNRLLHKRRSSLRRKG